MTLAVLIGVFLFIRGIQLTVNVDVAADVGAAEGVGHLTRDGLGEEGVVHDDLIGVSGHLLDDAAPLRPPDWDWRERE